MNKISFDDIAGTLVAQGVTVETVIAFRQYHRDNPKVWPWFERFALEAAKRGKQRGAKAIMERVRWEAEIEQGGEFKANNNYTAYYARVFVKKYPQYNGFFEFREVHGIKEAA